MKKLALCISLGLILTGCAPSFQKDEKIVQKVGKSKENSIIPSYSISDEYYKSIIPFEEGAARGLVVQGLNSRLDIDEFETGLMRIAQESFSTKDYLFQEGQFLSRDTVQQLVQRKRTDAQQAEAEKRQNNLNKKVKVPNLGLNPPYDKDAPGSVEDKNAKSPIYLSNILEHNYMIKNGNGEVEIGGVVIGLAMNSVHYYNLPPEQGGYPRETPIPEGEMLEQGKKMAQAILDVLVKQEKWRDVPVTFAIYRQEAKSSLVPGHFVTYTKLDKGETKVGDWDSIDERYYLFPSEAGKKDYREDNTKIENFKSDIAEYFPNNFTAVVGRGFYKDKQIQELKLDIPVQFNGKAEVIGFTQFVTGLIMEHFPNYVKVEVNIHSVGRQEAVILRDSEQEQPIVHIFD
ncbi:CamS family sex pheromone protein [Ectobacillus sp. JY-23]|uniref:CamS family sex pheromone protein n=1 Tax=Ectobacillus sp. JY-23 TaxID=2933872 RepID=UPI001FF58F3F|nr:CamS family sex pheromone protein [Ectobacillus sp. JY-23]UOY91609.1 CamS family sex pheromone protein [Ectobacillus sp. JY-23]